MSHRYFMAFLGALAGLAAASTDIYIASMPTITHLFHTHTAITQLTLSLFFIGFALSQLIWGPLSDRFGRKSMLIAGLALFVLGGLLCALSHSINELIVSRIIQAIGAGCSFVMAFSMIKDHFTDTDMGKAIRVVTVTMMLAPMIAPILGSYLLAWINWQATFYFLFLYGLVLLVCACLIPETYPKAKRTPLPVHTLFAAYSEQIKNHKFLFVAIAFAANFAVMFCFISASPFIYIKLYHVAKSDFGYFFAFNALALILGNLSTKRMSKRFSLKGLMFGASILSVCASILMIISMQVFPHTTLALALPCFLVTFGVGVLYPTTIGEALKHVVQHNGIASALANTIRHISAGCVGLVLGFFIAHSGLPLAWASLLLSAVTLGFLFLYFRR